MRARHCVERLDRGAHHALRRPPCCERARQQRVAEELVQRFLNTALGVSMNRFCVVLALLVSGCSDAVIAPADFEELRLKHLSDVSSISGSAYESSTLAVLESHSAPTTPECMRLQRAISRLEYVLVLDSGGRVSRSVSASGSEISECLAKEFASARFPAPPFAPFHLHVVQSESP